MHKTKIHRLMEDGGIPAGEKVLRKSIGRKTVFLIGFLLTIYYREVIAERSMYVDNFQTILGDEVAKNALLFYAQSRQIETL